jgi:hypothetical protein
MSEVTQTDKLLSVAEFGKRLGGISPATVHSWLSLGKFGLERTKVGGRTMLRESELLKVIHAGEKSSPKPRKSKQHASPKKQSETNLWAQIGTVHNALTKEDDAAQMRRKLVWIVEYIQDAAEMLDQVALNIRKMLEDGD